MTKFERFLSDQGAVFDERGVARVGAAPSQAADPGQTQLHFLTHLACLWLQGPDAKNFLQGQTTCNIDEVFAGTGTNGQWRQGAHCNTKGRMIFDFQAFSTHSQSMEKIGLITESAIVDVAQSSLKKYMVFSKSTLSTDENLAAIGVSGSGGREFLSNICETAIGDEKHTIVNTADDSVFTLNSNRYLWLTTTDTLTSRWQDISRNCALLGYSHWDLLEIQAGIGHVRNGTVEAFIPQDLNLQLTGAISFNKGCYIGQEIVARMQYRGKLKRHMRRALLSFKQTTSNPITTENKPPQPGQEVFSIANQQAVGHIVNAAWRDTDTIEILLNVFDPAFAEDRVYLNRETTEKLQFLPLPYAITN